MRALVWVAVVCLLACGGTSPGAGSVAPAEDGGGSSSQGTPDGGAGPATSPADAGPPDASTPDAGANTPDAGASDPGKPDAGPPDAGPAQATFMLRIRIEGRGAVASSSRSLACAQSCQGVFVAGTSVLLTATPDAGQKFAGWSGACAGFGNCTVAAEATVIANFVVDVPPVPKHTLKISVGGSGSVASRPAGILCGATCEASFDEGTIVALTEVPGSGAQFNTWTGACAGPGGCSVTMTADLQVNAWFEPAPNAASCLGIRAADPVQENGTGWYTAASWSCLPPVGDGLGKLAFGVSDPQQQSANMVVFNADFHGSSDVVAGLYLSGVTRVQQQSTGFFAWKQGTPQDAGAIAVTYWKPGESSYTMYGNLNGLFRPGVFASEESPHGLLLVSDLDTRTPSAVRAAVLLKANQTGSPEIAWGPIQLDARGPAFGAGVDAMDRTIVITDGSAKFGAGAISAEWLGPDGAPLTGEFLLQASVVPGANTWFETSALIGGGVLVRRMDLDARGTHSQALVTVASGSPVVAPPPGWMVARRDSRLKIARGGRAYAVLPFGAKGVACSQRVELIAPDGTFCSASTYTIRAGACDTADLALGEDGTVVQTSPPVFSTDDQGKANMSCTWQWWVGTLR